MLLSDTSLEQTLRAALRTFDIRTLEQLLEIGNSGRRLRLTAEALGVEREALQLHISKLREQHPDVRRRRLRPHAATRPVIASITCDNVGRRVRLGAPYSPPARRAISPRPGS